MTARTSRKSKKESDPISGSAEAQFEALAKARSLGEDSDPFLWLDRLVGLRVHSPAELATAIAQNGIYGFDRYGRFGERDPKSEEAQRALDALAEAYSAFKLSGTYQCDEIDALALSDFGWPSSKCPDFESIKDAAGQEPARKPADQRMQNADLALIAALLMVVKGEIGEGALYGIKDENPIINAIKDELKGYGLGKRTIQDKFADAKRLVARRADY